MRADRRTGLRRKAEGTALVVEDDAEVSKVLTRALARWGLAARTARTLDEAERKAAQAPPGLVLLDVRLPDGSGLDFLAYLRMKVPEAATVVMTGEQNLMLAARAMSEGAIEFLSKPFEIEDLEAIVRRWLDEDPVPHGKSGADPGDEAPRPGEGEGDADRLTLVGRHPSMITLFKRVGLAVSGHEPVLIRGETGTGKELVARTIHRLSHAERPFLAVNCAALPDTLLEAELFGHVRGAFTGAIGSRKGRFELAGRGTILLDEIGDTSLAFQTKILRVLQEEQFIPVGSEKVRPMRARVIAATHRNLEAMLEDGSFRSDLYYRIRVIELELPPLRHRAMDIPDLARHIARQAALSSSRAEVPEFTAEAIEALKAHSWPGNVRELENLVRRAIAMGGVGPIRAQDLELTPPEDSETSTAESLDEVIYLHTVAMLERCGGNKREAARRLDVSPGRLYRILQT